MEKIIKNKNFWFSLLFFAILSIFLFFYVRDHTEDFRAMLEINFVWILIISALNILVLVGYGVLNCEIFKVFGVNLSFMEGVRVSSMGAMGNLFLPFRGGAGLRAIYLKKKFQLKYTDFLSTFGGLYIIDFLVNIFLGIIGVFMILMGTGIFHTVLFFILIGAFIGIFAIVVLKIDISLLRRIKFLTKVWDKVDEVLIAWDKVKKNKIVFRNLFLISLINALFSLTVFLAINYALGVKLSLGNALIYNCLSLFSLLIGFTPAAIGVRETVVVIFQNAIGLTTGQIIKISILDRVINFCATMLWFFVIEAYFLIVNKFFSKKR